MFRNNRPSVGTKRDRRTGRNVVLSMLWAFLATAAVPLTTHAAGTPPTPLPLPSLGTPPREGAISGSANPNLTPFLFSQDPTESAPVYVGSQEYAAANASACGGAQAAEQGACCPTSLSDGACDDHDPALTGCADANSYTVTQAYISDNAGNVIGLLETRYSPTCNTNWGRITGYGPFATAIKQVTVCRGQQGQYSDSGCTDTDTGTESTRFSDQLYAPTECAFVVGVLVPTDSSAAPSEYTATTPPAC